MPHNYMRHIGSSEKGRPTTDLQSRPRAEANAPNSVPPRIGNHKVPRTVPHGLAIQSFAAQRGWAIYNPSVRNGPIDTILYDGATERLFKVVVKRRWSIDKRYIGRDFWIGFHVQDGLYLMPHDEMVEASLADDGFSLRLSWKQSGRRTRTQLSAYMRGQCAPYRITPEPGEFWVATPTPLFVH